MMASNSEVYYKIFKLGAIGPRYDCLIDTRQVQILVNNRKIEIRFILQITNQAHERLYQDESLF